MCALFGFWCVFDVRFFCGDAWGCVVKGANERPLNVFFIHKVYAICSQIGSVCSVFNLHCQYSRVRSSVVC